MSSKHAKTHTSLFLLVLFPVNDTLCPAAIRACKSDLRALCGLALAARCSCGWSYHAIISISTGALALTLPDITVQHPTLLACQKQQLQGHVSLSPGFQLPSARSQRKKRRVSFFILHLHSESTSSSGHEWNITHINVTCKNIFWSCDRSVLVLFLIKSQWGWNGFRGPEYFNITRIILTQITVYIQLYTIDFNLTIYIIQEKKSTWRPNQQN